MLGAGPPDRIWNSSPRKSMNGERVGCLYKERRVGWKHMYLDDEAAIGIYNSWHMRAGKDGWQDKQI